MELFSVRESDNENIRITIKLVGDLMVGDHHYIQFYNMLTRKCLQHLKLQLVGRDFFDAKNKVCMCYLLQQLLQPQLFKENLPWAHLHTFELGIRLLSYQIIFITIITDSYFFYQFGLND